MPTSSSSSCLVLSLSTLFHCTIFVPRVGRPGCQSRVGPEGYPRERLSKGINIIITIIIPLLQYYYTLLTIIRLSKGWARWDVHPVMRMLIIIINNNGNDKHTHKSKRNNDTDTDTDTNTNTDTNMYL